MNNKKGLLGLVGLALAGAVGGCLYVRNKKAKEGTEQVPNAETVENNDSNTEE